jgi:cytosine/adenosine deaminase-related metal-dependent hydrolase
MAAHTIQPVAVHDGAPAVHRAGWLVADPDTVIRNGYLVVAAGRVQSVGSGRCPVDAAVTDHGPGVLVPGLVNAHTHLELTALAGAVRCDGGFLDWVRRLVAARDQTAPEALARGARRGVETLVSGGCAAVGEIATLGLSWEALALSDLAGIWFREAYGAQAVPELPPPIGGGSPWVAASLAGHAPHTTAPALLTALKQAARRRRRPFAIHLAESVEETAFIATGCGDWADFLTARGISFAQWPIGGQGPVAYCRGIGLLDAGTLAVHLLQTEAKDWRLLTASGVNSCICPRSNRLLHGRFPDLPGMLAAGLRPALGTDSLASAPSLSIFDEMRTVFDRYPTVAPRQILAMATVNGSAALGFGDRYGRLTPGAAAAMVYLEVAAASAEAVLEALAAAGKPFDPCKDREEP